MALILIGTVIFLVIVAPWILGSLFWWGEHKH